MAEETGTARVLDVLRYAPSVQLPERWGKPPEPPPQMRNQKQKQRRTATATCRVGAAEFAAWRAKAERTGVGAVADAAWAGAWDT